MYRDIEICPFPGVNLILVSTVATIYDSCNLENGLYKTPSTFWVLNTYTILNREYR